MDISLALPTPSKGVEEEASPMGDFNPFLGLFLGQGITNFTNSKIKKGTGHLALPLYHRGLFHQFLLLYLFLLYLSHRTYHNHSIFALNVCPTK